MMEKSNIALPVFDYCFCVNLEKCELILKDEEMSHIFFQTDMVCIKCLCVQSILLQHCSNRLL